MCCDFFKKCCPSCCCPTTVELHQPAPGSSVRASRRNAAVLVRVGAVAHAAIPPAARSNAARGSRPQTPANAFGAHSDPIRRTSSNAKLERVLGAGAAAAAAVVVRQRPAVELTMAVPSPSAGSAGAISPTNVALSAQNEDLSAQTERVGAVAASALNSTPVLTFLSPATISRPPSPQPNPLTRPPSAGAAASASLPRPPTSDAAASATLSRPTSARAAPLTRPTSARAAAVRLAPVQLPEVGDYRLDTLAVQEESGCIYLALPKNLLMADGPDIQAYYHLIRTMKSDQIRRNPKEMYILCDKNFKIYAITSNVPELTNIPQQAFIRNSIRDLISSYKPASRSESHSGSAASTAPASLAASSTVSPQSMSGTSTPFGAVASITASATAAASGPPAAEEDMKLTGEVRVKLQDLIKENMTNGSAGLRLNLFVQMEARLTFQEKSVVVRVNAPFANAYFCLVKVAKGTAQEAIGNVKLPAPPPPLASGLITPLSRSQAGQSAGIIRRGKLAPLHASGITITPLTMAPPALGLADNLTSAFAGKQVSQMQPLSATQGSAGGGTASRPPIHPAAEPARTRRGGVPSVNYKNTAFAGRSDDSPPDHAKSSSSSGTSDDDVQLIHDHLFPVPEPGPSAAAAQATHRPVIAIGAASAGSKRTTLLSMPRTSQPAQPKPHLAPHVLSLAISEETPAEARSPRGPTNKSPSPHGSMDFGMTLGGVASPDPLATGTILHMIKSVASTVPAATSSAAAKYSVPAAAVENAAVEFTLNSTERLTSITRLTPALHQRPPLPSGQSLAETSRPALSPPANAPSNGATVHNSGSALPPPPKVGPAAASTNAGASDSSAAAGPTQSYHARMLKRRTGGGAVLPSDKMTAMGPGAASELARLSGHHRTPSGINIL